MEIKKSLDGVIETITDFYGKLKKLFKLALDNRERLDQIENYLMRVDGDQPYLPTMSFISRRKDLYEQYQNELNKNNEGKIQNQK